MHFWTFGLNIFFCFYFGRHNNIYISVLNNSGNYSSKNKIKKNCREKGEKSGKR
jgi:hypothetical protein